MAQALSGQRGKRVCRGRGRQDRARLADTGGFPVTGQQLHPHVRRIGHARNRIIVEVSLLYQAVFYGDSFREAVAQSMDDAAFQLRLDIVRLDSQADIGCDPHVMYDDFFPFPVVGNFGYRRGGGAHVVSVGNTQRPPRFVRVPSPPSRRQFQ